MLHSKEQQLKKEENSAFQLAALSLIGDREEQQDSIGYSLKNDEGLVVVCDGMGGHKGGKIASNLAVQVFLECYSKNQFDSNNVRGLIEASHIADEKISQLKDQYGELLKAGSTLVSILIKNKKLLWCSIGDSRAYLIRNSEMVQLTQDHNYHTVLIEKLNAGLIDSIEFKREDERGEALISFLGIGNLTLIDYNITPFELQTEDKIIIMSDGLYKIVNDSEIARILDNFNNIDEAVQALEMKAKKKTKNLQFSRDNMTIAIIKIK